MKCVLIISIFVSPTLLTVLLMILFLVGFADKGLVVLSLSSPFAFLPPRVIAEVGREGGELANKIKW